MGDLIERLNATGETVSGVTFLRNPDGPEAASRIAELEAERDEYAQAAAVEASAKRRAEAKLAKASGALERIERNANAAIDQAPLMRRIARQALASIQERP